MLRVTPSEAIVFNKVENELCGQVKITNIDHGAVTYKIKTTAPEKFRVRPSTGVLSKGASATIVVIFNQGNSPTTINRDKFLVMAMPIHENDANDSQHLTDLWKNTSSGSAAIEQHRLRCALGDTDVDLSMKNGKPYDTFDSSVVSSSDHRANVQASFNIQTIKDSVHETRSQLKSIQRLQWITIVLMVILSISVIYILKLEIKSNSSEYCTRQQ